MVDASVALRAGGGAAILVGGAVGVALPALLARLLRDGAPWLLYTKAAAAGVILSLAIIHLINHAFHEFAELEPGACRLRRHKHGGLFHSRCASALPREPLRAVAPCWRAAGGSHSTERVRTHAAPGRARNVSTHGHLVPRTGMRLIGRLAAQAHCTTTFL